MKIYAFSIDNFRRRAEEVQYLMDLILEKIEGLLDHKSIVNRYGVRVHFVGNLKLLSEPVRLAAEEVMEATANNTKRTLLVCLAYSSTDEIVHAVQESCEEKWNEIQEVNANQAQNIETTKEMLELNDVINDRKGVYTVAEKWWRTAERRGYLVVVGLFRQRRKDGERKKGVWLVVSYWCGYGAVVVSGRHYRPFGGQIRRRQLAENGVGGELVVQWWSSTELRYRNSSELAGDGRGPLEKKQQ
ncbi:hypothetical protein K7X08_019917 [Anisodus acutangulus]|uniref:Uncharacterized protein n=1 Tax=Anisodus acutangulus TaxID=402998 RepID=A0A9Q1MTG0_9SOLA|nr:hypothetical protein K7X08_019917 [Anisodus acutangulus]